MQIGQNHSFDAVGCDAEGPMDWAGVGPGPRVEEPSPLPCVGHRASVALTRGGGMQGALTAAGPFWKQGEVSSKGAHRMRVEPEEQEGRAEPGRQSCARAIWPRRRPAG